MKAKVKIIFGSRFDAKGAIIPGGRLNHAGLLQIESVLEEVKYRDWEWVLLVDGDMVTIGSTFEVTDSAPPHKPMTLSFFGAAIPTNDPMTDETIVDRAWYCVRKFALHEAAEWFRYKGAMIHDPHKQEFVRSLITGELLYAGPKTGEFKNLERHPMETPDEP